MTISRFTRLSGALALSAATLLAPAQGLAADPITVTDAWARATIPNRPGAAYFTLHNAGDSADRLVAASSPAAARAELHTHIMDGDVMKMRRVEAIDAPAGGMVMLAPGGDHVMLFDLAEPLKEGDSLMLVLTFEQAGEVEVMATVQAMGAKGPAGGMSHGTKHEGHSQ